MIFSKILVAYDGSNLGHKALDKAIELAKLDPETKVEALHVFKFPDLIVGEAYVSTTPNMKETIYEDAQKVLDRAKLRLDTTGVKHQVKMVEGQPANEIVSYANGNHFDLIVIGSRGLSGLKELFLGSVSHNVVQHSHVPVLVVK